MKALWDRLAGRYDGLSLRERVFVALALLALVAYALGNGFLAPQLARRDAAQRELEAVRGESQAVVRQIAAASAAAADPDATARLKLSRLRRELSGVDGELREVARQMVEPAQMPQVLKDLLAGRKGLRLVALRTLPASPFPGTNSGEEKRKGGAAIYRHGVELTVRGSYLDLLGYLSQIERSPHRLYWGDAQLDAQDYPLSSLTLTLFTLSMDAAWIAL